MARARIETKGGIVGQVIFHPSAGVLFMGDAFRGGVRSWDTDSGLLQTRFENPFPHIKITALTLAMDGRTLAACILGKGVVLWDTSSGGLTDRLTPESWDASALAFTPDGRTLVAAGWDGTIRVGTDPPGIRGSSGRHRARADGPAWLSRPTAGPWRPGEQRVGEVLGSRQRPSAGAVEGRRFLLPVPGLLA